MVEALKEVRVGKDEIEVEVHVSAAPLLDFQGRQTHYVTATGDVANIIVRRKYVKGWSNDLGFVRDVDGSYIALISEYDGNKSCGPEWQLALKKSYGEKVLIKTAQKQGFRYLGKEKVNGKTQIKWLDIRA